MKTLIKNTFLITSILAIVMAFTSSTFGQSYVINLQYNPMSFTNANRSIVYNAGQSGKAEGSIHRYDNLATIEGKTIYGLLTLEEMQDIFIVDFDDDAITGEQHRFQPRLGSDNNNGGGYLVYKLQFFNTDDDLPVFLYNYWMTGVDVDGNGSNREYEEVGGYTSYETSSLCQLTISTNPITGRTRFLGIDYSLSGVTFENKASWMANFENANNEITFALGQTAKNSVRYYSVQFGQEGGEFTDPVVIQNPLPLAIDDVSPMISSVPGGVAISSVLDNDIYDGNPIVAGDVTISAISTVPSGIVFNTSTGEVSVNSGTPGGVYTFNYQICLTGTSDCDVAMVTVTVVEADLEILKTSSETEVEQGQSFVYTLTVTNNGPTTSESVEITDVIPSNLTIVGSNPSIGAWNASTWTIGDMVDGASATLTLAVETSSSFTGTIVNTATASSSTFDPDLNNNTDDVSVLITETIPVVNNFPATGFGTLAFEDLWPGKGDYDFNDLVLDYKFEITTNSSNYINEVIGTFVIKAFGAGLENGFGFQLSDAIDQSAISVSGSSITESYITLAGNGVEDGQSKPTIIVFDNDYNEIVPPAGETGVNTTPGGTYMTPVTITITITFPSDTYTSSDLSISNFNPFLIVNQDRGIEVHLPDYEPTDLANQSLFGSEHDDSDATEGKYYKTENNLPWAINIYESFDYPVEKANIISTHLKFVEWATSSGNSFPDWYKDINGYRNTGNIYVIP